MATGITNNPIRIGATIDPALRKNAGVFTLAEINELFTAIAAVVNAKVGVDEEVVLSGVALTLGKNQLFNLPYAVNDSDPVPLQQLQSLV